MAQKSITSFFTSKIVKTDEKQELKCSVNDKSPASDANASKKRLHSGSDTDEGNKIRKKEDIKQNSTNVNKSAVKKSIKKKTDIIISPGLKPGIAKILLKQYEKSPSNHSDESNSGNENLVTEIKCQKKEKEVKKRRRIINPIDSSSEDEANSKQDKNDNKSSKNNVSKDITSSDNSAGNTVLKEVNVQIEENANSELKLKQSTKEEENKEKVEEEQSENNVQKKSIKNTQEKDECIDSDSNVSSVLSKSQNGCGKTESKIKNFFAPKQSKTIEKKGKEKLSPKSKKESDSPSKNGKESDSSPKGRKESNSPHKSRKESVSPAKNIKLSNDSTKNGQYNPSVSNYHPIDNASWKVGEKTPYSALSRTLEEIENISARLKIIEILSNYFRSVIVLSPDDLLPSVYLCLNKLAPAYEGLELGIAEVTLMKAIAQSTGRTVSQIKKNAQEVGDLGIVAEQSRSNQRMMFQPARLTVKSVYDKLKEIAKMTGTASVSKKVDKIQSMFVACQQAEARYLIRSLAGKLRIGLAEQSVLQALALACTMTPPGQEYPPADINVSTKMGADNFKTKYDEASLIIKTTYCECPNYDKIIPVLLQHGVKNLPEHCKLTPGIPLKPMLAHPTKGVQEVLTRFENLKFTCEWKYDGERAQIHILENGTINIYSRNQEDNTSKYPDIISRIPNTKQSSVSSCILDCEAVAWDLEKKQILPFQILSTRKRKDASEDDIKVRVCVFMFDLLYLNGESLVKKPLIERRKLLHEHFQEKEGEWCFATSLDTNTMEEVQDFLEESVKGNCEGLMIKTLEKDATYEIAKRSRNWLKLKKDYLEGIGDTLDLVVLGGYLGKGKRTGTYGGFLLFCFHSDTETYESVCKIGTGFSDEDLQKHTEFFKEHVIPEPKSYYQYDTSSEPDHWFNPVQVWEVKCADFSLSPVYRAAIGIADPEKGISLRFPRFIRVRDDKSVEEASSSFHIADMYSNQSQIKNQQGTKNEEEDFYFM